MDDQDEGMERGDETPRWPPVGSPEWRERMRAATEELRETQQQINEHCRKIHEGVAKLFGREPF